jgi:hypothetical protein
MGTIILKATFYCELNHMPYDQVIRSLHWMASLCWAVIWGYKWALQECATTIPTSEIAKSISS